LQEKTAGDERLTAAEAFAAVLYGAVAADGTVTHAEALALAHTLSRTSMFVGLAEPQMHAALARARSFTRARGLEAMLAYAAHAVPQDLRETAYARCVGLVMADDIVNPPELAYLRKAQTALGVSDGTALKIVEVVKILNKG